MSDPFHRQILEALNHRLDGDRFEECACDLLLERFPTLVPITGGQDGGMDGAIAEGEDEPLPLVCTTQDNVIGNLTRSLEGYLRTGGRCSKVVVATSRALSPLRQRNLRDRARELGFVLIQVYEQRAIATLLYRSSRWCQELLDLSGQPGALSVLPPSLSRPLVEIELLGRETDGEWLRTTSGDRVLVGGPGVGKTYFLYRMALEGWGLFLASDGEAEVANAIRDQKPEVIVVDDAHTDPERLEKLAGLRQRIGATFSILATTWSGGRDDVAAALSSPEARIRTLEPLPRRQILQIFEELGVEASDEDLLELVDQAANMPGLATTLAALWLEGDWLSVLRGEVLASDALSQIRRLVGRDEAGLLSVLSLGGRCGMPAKRVGEKLGLKPLETWERLASLAAAGVLAEVGDDCLAVQPRALRSVLLSSVFFGPILDYRDFLDLAPGYDCSVREIVTAAARGARISTEELQGLLGRLDPAEYPFRKEAAAAWGTFVGLGDREARWAYENYPGELVDIAAPGLYSAPGVTIPRLLAQAEALLIQASSSRAHSPLGLLEDWLFEITSPVEETLERRHEALRAASGFAEAATSPGAFAAAFRLGCLTLRPTLRSERMDPTRTALITRRGPLPQVQLKEMKGVWEQALRLFEITGVVSFPELFNELNEWIRLAGFRGRTSEDEERFIHRSVREMLRDLAPLAAGQAGLTVALVRLASELSVELPLDPDPRFEILFPPISEGMPFDSGPLEVLVDEWVDASPAEAVETLFSLTQEAESIAGGYYNRASDVCRMLAAKTQDPGQWFEVLMEKDAPSSWLAPFLERVSALPGFDDRVRRCLEDEAYAEIGIRSALRLPELTPDLLETALEKAVDSPSVVRGMGFRRELATSVAQAILAHPDPALALAMAFGEWMAEPKGEVRPDLAELWRQAVLRTTGLGSSHRLASYELQELLVADPELAYEWLLRLDTGTPRPDSKIRAAAEVAVGTLEPERRRDLLERLTADSVLVDYLPQLIGQDVELYQRLLGRESLEVFHLVPLRGLPGPDWANLATVALREGFGPEEVALAAYSGSHARPVWRGTEEEYWRRWDEAFASLDPPAGTDSGWQEMIRCGREHARKRISEGEQLSRSIDHDGMFILADPG